MAVQDGQIGEADDINNRDDYLTSEVDYTYTAGNDLKTSTKKAGVTTWLTITYDYVSLKQLSTMETDQGDGVQGGAGPAWRSSRSWW